jgi:hypothetical protein
MCVITETPKGALRSRWELEENEWRRQTIGFGFPARRGCISSPICLDRLWNPMHTGHSSGGKTTEVNNAHNVTSTPGLRLQELELGQELYRVTSMLCEWPCGTGTRKWFYYPLKAEKSSDIQDYSGSLNRIFGFINYPFYFVHWTTFRPY